MWYKANALTHRRAFDSDGVSGSPLFLVDAMCHPLVSWLRIFDYDKLGALELGHSLPDRELIERAMDDGRILVTRDRDLSEVASGRGIAVVLIEGNETVGHLRQLVTVLGIEHTPKSNRCSVCNGQLMKVAKRDITDEIALRVAGDGKDVWVCCSCRQHFWKGSQWASIERIAGEIGNG